MPVHDAMMLGSWGPEEWTAAGTVAYAIIAFLGAVFVYFQVREARRTREEQARPFVVVDVQPSRVWWNIFNLVVENVGTTVAHDVKIKFVPDVGTSQQGYDLAGSALLTEGIPTLPPRRRIEVLFDLAHERKKTELPSRYEVEVTFLDARRRVQQPLKYVVDLGYLYGLQRVDEYGVHHAAKALREIEKMVRSSRYRGRLAVWVRNEDEDHEAERIEEAMTGHLPTLARRPPPEIVLHLGRNVLVRELVRAVRKLVSRSRPSDGP